MLPCVTGSPETMDLSGPSAPQPADLPDQTATASRVWEGSEADPEGTATGKDDAMLGKQTGALGVVGAALGEDGTAVRNADCDKWLKFNDVNVSVVAWDDVQRESFGDSRNTSAYCVIYVADDGSWEEKGEAVRHVAIVSKLAKALMLMSRHFSI